MLAAFRGRLPIVEDLQTLERAIDEAYARGFLGRNVLGSGFACTFEVDQGAGARCSFLCATGRRSERAGIVWTSAASERHCNTDRRVGLLG